jgi:hypothetical protein
MAADVPMLMRMGTQTIGALSSFSISKTQHSMEVSARAHRETMSALSAGIQQNAITVAEINTQDSAVRLSSAIQSQSIKDRGAAAVSAAAAGVAGGSVEATMRGLRRSALNAQSARMRNLDSSLQASAQDRKNIELAQIMGKDISILPAPSSGAALLGLGASLLDTWDANQPQGLTSTDRLAERLRR